MREKCIVLLNLASKVADWSSPFVVNPYIFAKEDFLDAGDVLLPPLIVKNETEFDEEELVIL